MSYLQKAAVAAAPDSVQTCSALDGPSLGLFSIWQDQYARLHLPTFPVDGKKPAVRGYLRVDVDTSRKLALKFSRHDSFGLALGARTGITVVDVDTTDESVLKDWLYSHGDTPFLVRSVSGHFQAWYRHNDERRWVRPFQGLPIDVLGNGYVVAPPSRTLTGSYKLISGSLKDLERLPTLSGLGSLVSRPSARSACSEGQRNNQLFRHALRQARYVDDKEALLDVVETENALGCQPPLADEEVRRLVASAWRYQTEGRNYVGEKATHVTANEINELASYPDALALLLVLRCCHPTGRKFALGKAMATRLGWTVPRFRRARSDLERLEQIRCLHAGGRGPHDPPIYVLVGVRFRASI